MTHVVDTHALVWFLRDDLRLGPAASNVFDDIDGQLVVPTIVLAEVAFLHAKGRISLGLQETLAYIEGVANCSIHPFDESVVKRLPLTLDIHDSIIVATAIMFRDVVGEDTAIISKDREITESGLIRVVW